jgi:hypothetical protein
VQANSVGRHRTASNVDHRRPPLAKLCPSILSYKVALQD